MTVLAVHDFRAKRNIELVALYKGLARLAAEGKLAGGVGCVMEITGKEHAYAVGLYRDPGRASNAGFRIQQGAANADSMFG